MTVSKDLRRQATMPLAILLVGAMVSFWLVKEQERRNQSLVESQFRAQVERIAAEVSRRIQDYEHGLKSTRSVIEAVGAHRLTREHFRNNQELRNVDAEFPGARGFGFVRRVPHAEEEQFVAAARLDGWPTFRIRELSPNLEDRFVIQYIEPVERNRPAVGLDIASERNRRTAALEAIRLDRAAITAPITLVQASGAENRAFEIFLPLYRPGKALETPEQRDAATWGWTYATLVLDEVLSDFLRSSPEVWWTVADVGDDGHRVPVFSQQQGDVTGLPNQAWTLPVFSRRWEFQASATPFFMERIKLTSPALVGMSGGIVTALLLSASLLWSGSRRRREESLAARAQLATIVEHSDRAVVGQDNAGKVMLWNRTAEKLFRVPAPAALGKELTQVLAAHGLHLTPVTRDDLSDVDERTELMLTGAGREPRVLLVSRSPIYSADEVLLGSATLLADITERRSMEVALANSNQLLEVKVHERTQALTKAETFLQTVLDSVPSVIAYWDHEGECRAANAAFLQWRRLPREAVLGRTMGEVLPPSRLEGLAEDLQRAWRGETRAVRFTERDREHLGVRSFAGSLIPDRHDGQVQGLYFVADDITDLQRSEMELEAALIAQRGERRRLEGIIEGTNAGTWEWNIPTGEMRVNERWAEITGYRLEDIAPLTVQAWRSMIHPDDLAPSGRLLEDHFQGRLPRFECEMRMRHRDGHWVWVLTHGGITTWSEDGKPHWMFGTHQDVTHRHQMEDELREAMRRANAASDAKTRFLASMSHEIRTPLNALLGMHRMLMNAGLDTQQAQWLEKADRAGRSLLELLNNVLDLGKIEAGEMALQPEYFNLRDLFDELSDIYTPSAQAKGIEFSARVTGSGDCWMLADRLRLRQILVNLVGNSIKFTETGGVLLIGQPERDGSAGTLRLTVRDSGMGIAPDALPHLFQPFVQADGSMARRFGGSGLGLSIVRSLVDLMQGSISVSSALDGGSTFSVEIPLVEVPESALQQARNEQRPVTVGYLCSEHGHCAELEQRLASLGWRGVDLRQEAEPQALDAMLLDAACLPDAQACIRRASRNGEDFPLASVLMVGDEPALQALRGTPLQDARTVALPVGISALFNALVEMLSGVEEVQDRLMRKAGLLAGGVRWLEGVRVFVVDDSEINREIALDLLRGQGALCEEFAGGQDIVHRLQQGGDDVDVVLMDVQMPLMDGLQATRLIRQLPGARDLPVIALSAGVLQSEREQAFAAGMVDFLSKPLEPMNVVKVLRRVVRDRRGSAVEVALPAGNGLGSTYVVQDAWPEVVGIDAGHARTQLNGDPALFLRLLRVMRLSYAGWADEWLVTPRDWEDQERQALCASLHKMRGSASMLGALSLAAAAGKAELHHRDGRNAVDPALLLAVANVLAALLSSIDSVLAALPSVDAVSEVPEIPQAGRSEPLRALLAQIRENDLSAMETAAGHRDRLLQLLGPGGCAMFETRLEELRFEEAAGLLQASLERQERPLHANAGETN